MHTLCCCAPHYVHVKVSLSCAMFPAQCQRLPYACDGCAQKEAPIKFSSKKTLATQDYVVE